MPFSKFVTIDLGSIASGATAEKSWESDGEFMLRRVFMVEKAGASINAVEVTIRADGDVYTEDYVPAVILSHLNTLNPELNKLLPKGRKIVFGVKNNEAASRSLYAVLELWASE